ncbi:MAG: 16S rRNA (adenine(1518)-N(6)/adenine(1519)-N(6))-dimethyltransferase RsmA [Bacteroidales bacterium]|nr:16S rRNA (adenine(1518)-N(6)/adenine(1519)-N(6))-dimethyltransferase RsmA [Bacteroidales bacterium]
MQKVRPKKSLGQHFLTDKDIAARIVDSLKVSEGASIAEDVLEVGPGTGVLTGLLLKRPDVNLKMVELDPEAVEYLRGNFPGMEGRLMEADFLKLNLASLFPGSFSIIGNFPYNISSQIFFKVLEHRDRIPQVICMIQKEVAERIAEPPGTKTYGILSVFLQAWYDIEYLFTVGPGAFAPPPKVHSAVIRLTRNSRTELGCDESLFRAVVKSSFGLRRKTLRNSLKPLVLGINAAKAAELLSAPVFDLRPEKLSVEDFISLTRLLSEL